MKLFVLLISLFFFGFTKASLYCNGLIDDSFNKMSSSSTNEICSKINGLQNRIMIRLTDDVSHQGFNYDSFYDLDSDKYFASKCPLNGGNCRISTLISVYFYAQKIRITVGSDIDRMIPQLSRLTIIDKMKTHLQKNQFEVAFNVAVNEIKSKLPAVSYHTNNKTENHDQSLSGWGVFFIILLTLGCLACCIWCLWVKQKDEERLLEQPSEQSIHIHLERLLDIVKFKIKGLSPPITSIEQCVICMEFLNPYWERDTVSGATNSNIFLTRFNCGHYYHSACLNRKGIYDCLMCNEHQIQVPVEPSFRYYNTVTDDNIFNVIKNFDKIYPKPLLSSYKTNYKKDVVVIEEVYPSYCPGMIIWVDPMPMTLMGTYQPPTVINQNYYGDGGGGYYNNNSNYNYGNNNNNYYTSTTGGDYGQVNNNYMSSTSGADYGVNNNYELQNMNSTSGGNDLKTEGGDY